MDQIEIKRIGSAQATPSWNDNIDGQKRRGQMVWRKKMGPKRGQNRTTRNGKGGLEGLCAIPSHQSERLSDTLAWFQAADLLNLELHLPPNESCIPQPPQIKKKGA
jgi:hypothetical protein